MICKHGYVVLILAHDTDIFALACHYIYYGFFPIQVYMQSPMKGCAVLDINASVNHKDHSTPMPYLLAAHALSGCDTVGSYFDIGKSTVIKIVKSGQQ